MTKAMQELSHILYTQLLQKVPVLSGNMKKHIRIDSIKDNEITYVIEAPPYDVEHWKQTKTIVYTGEPYNYAWDVNQFGGFFRNNKSKYWANRACLYACVAMPNAVVDNHLEV